MKKHEWKARALAAEAERDRCSDVLSVAMDALRRIRAAAEMRQHDPKISATWSDTFSLVCYVEKLLYPTPGGHHPYCSFHRGELVWACVSTCAVKDDPARGRPEEQRLREVLSVCADELDRYFSHPPPPLGGRGPLGGIIARMRGETKLLTSRGDSILRQRLDEVSLTLRSWRKGMTLSSVANADIDALIARCNVSAAADAKVIE